MSHRLMCIFELGLKVVGPGGKAATVTKLDRVAGTVLTTMDPERWTPYTDWIPARCLPEAAPCADGDIWPTRGMPDNLVRVLVEG